MNNLQKLICLVLVLFLAAFLYFLFMSPYDWAYPPEWNTTHNWKVYEADLDRFKHTGMIGTGIACGLCIGMLIAFRKR